MTTDNTNSSYSTLDDIRNRKQQLRQQMDSQQQQVHQLWRTLFAKPSESTRGQFVQSVIANSALAIDAFLLLRKLRRSYKDAWDPKAAYDEIVRCSGTQFDPKVVNAFVAAYDEIDAARRRYADEQFAGKVA